MRSPITSASTGVEVSVDVDGPADEAVADKVDVSVVVGTLVPGIAVSVVDDPGLAVVSEEIDGEEVTVLAMDWVAATVLAPTDETVALVDTSDAAIDVVG